MPRRVSWCPPIWMGAGPAPARGAMLCGHRTRCLIAAQRACPGVSLRNRAPSTVSTSKVLTLSSHRQVRLSTDVEAGCQPAQVTSTIPDLGKLPSLLWLGSVRPLHHGGSALLQSEGHLPHNSRLPRASWSRSVAGNSLQRSACNTIAVACKAFEASTLLQVRTKRGREERVRR